MLKQILILFLFFVGQFYFAQTNLVLNPSFESYTSCPNATGVEVNKAVGWDSCRASPDYFNICSTSSYVQVPRNYFGYQKACNGNAYCGFYTYSSSGFYREIIIGQLISPLSVSQKYYISFKVSRGDSNYTVGYSTNKIGVKFTKVKQGYTKINNFAHFYSNSIITDTINWTVLSGSFIADSAYQYIMAGNFFDDANTSMINHGNGPIAYYYIDDLCVSTDSVFASNYSTGIKSFYNKKSWDVFPNPANNFIFITGENDNEVKVYNSIGEEIYKQDHLNAPINCSSWSSGLYFIMIERSIFKLNINH